MGQNKNMHLNLGGDHAILEVPLYRKPHHSISAEFTLFTGIGKTEQRAKEDLHREIVDYLRKGRYADHVESPAAAEPLNGGYEACSKVLFLHVRPWPYREGYPTKNPERLKEILENEGLIHLTIKH